MPNMRMIAAAGAIVALVAFVYVFSIVPYLAGPAEGQPTGRTSPGLEILVPAAAIPLILVLVFLVPARHRVERVDRESGRKISVSRPQSYEQVGEHRFRIKSLVAGSIGGFAAALVLVGLIFMANSIMGLPVGTFYSVIAMAIAGITQPQLAIYFGLGLHLLTGTAIGGVFGYLSAAIGPFNITGIRKGAPVGILAGFISFSLLFIPITRFNVEPALTGILYQSGVVASNEDPAAVESLTTDIMSSVLAYSIVFHIVYGAITGMIAAVLLERLPMSRLWPARSVERSNERRAEGDVSEAT